MKRHLYLIITAYLLVCANAASAQKTLWGITDNGSSGSVYYINTESGGLQKAVNAQGDAPLGANPAFLMQSSNGEIFGISRNSEVEGQGAIFRVAKSGWKRVYTLPAGVAENASLVEGNDGYLYGVGGTSGNYQMFKVRPHGTTFQIKKITIPYYQPSGFLSRTGDGTIVGVSSTGGTNGAGFVYRIESNFSAITPIFHFNNANGKRPVGRLVSGPDGALYGITNAGGNSNYGTVFKLNPDGSQFQVLHHFNNVQGSYPSAGPALAADGTIYGTTRKGGKYSKGTIFQISASGQNFTVLYHFNGTGGENPETDLIIDSSGALYGTAAGGTPKFGLTYRFIPTSKVFTKLHEFTDERPAGNLLLNESPFEPSVILLSPSQESTNAAVRGTFKSREWPGTAQYTLELSTSQEFTNPIVFSSASVQFPINENLEFSTKYFARVKSNAWPAYGSATSFTTRSAEDYSFVVKPVDGATEIDSRQCTVVAAEVPGAKYYKVQLSTTSDFTRDVLSDSSILENERTFRFNNLRFGARYYARSGSDKSGYGKVTSFTTAAAAFITVIEPENGASDVNFRVMKIAVDQAVAGSSTLIAISQSSNFSTGAIVRATQLPGQTEFIIRNLQPSTTYYVRAWQEGSTFFGPTTSFTTREEAPARRLWGIASRGGANGLGSIFSFSIDSLTLTKHYDYEHEYDFIYLNGDLVETSSGFAATSIADGTGGGEVITFSADGVTTLEDYGPHDGSLILGSDNYLYVVDDWINLFQGGIYRLHSSGQDQAGLNEIIHRFERRDGNNPRTQLYERADGYLYGVAPYEGENEHGTIFRVKIDGSEFQVIHHFSGNDGSVPSGSLIENDDGYLYGVAAEGGANNLGVIFKVLPSGDGFTVLHHFNGSNGSTPNCALLAHAGKVYGTASKGGADGQGVVFSINRDGSAFTNLVTFSGSNGSTPLAGLTLGADGYLYGTTSSGGSSNLGVIYRVHPSTLRFKALHSFTPDQGGAPNGRLIDTDDNFFGTPGNARALVARQESDTEVLYYPNPFSTSFQAELRGTDNEPVEYSLSDMGGNTVESVRGEGEAVSLGERLPKGLYILKIRQGNNTSTFRVVKN